MKLQTDDNINVEYGQIRHATLLKTQESLPSAIVVWWVSSKHHFPLAEMLSDRAHPRPAA